jgi:ComF family protein
MFWFEDLISLLFPKICVCCGNSLWKHEEIICRFCEYHLPYTAFHLVRDNPVEQVFMGRQPIVAGTAYLRFNKGSRVQRLIHDLKYRDRKDIGVFLGRKLGTILATTEPYNTADYIIPVPLHKKKLMKRGYNQSEQFANGLSAAMKIPVDKFNLVRIKATDTQTRKSRFKRYQNVNEIFRVLQPERLAGKHILLVDDVLTTGATLEACMMALRCCPDIRISCATIAVATI